MNYKYRSTRENIIRFLFVVGMFSALALYIYGLATGEVGSPWDCPAGSVRATGWSGGRYTVLCIEGK